MGTIQDICLHFMSILKRKYVKKGNVRAIDFFPGSGGKNYPDPDSGSCILGENGKKFGRISFRFVSPFLFLEHP